MAAERSLVEDKVQQWLYRYCYFCAKYSDRLAAASSKSEAEVDGRRRHDDSNSVSRMFLVSPHDARSSDDWGRESRGHDGVVWSEGASQSRSPSATSTVEAEWSRIDDWTEL